MTRTLDQEGGGPTIADFDRDGILDCITAEGFIVFHRGVGDGTFEKPIETGAFTQSGCAEAFDVDGNGTLDLITYRASEQPIAVYLGLGNGTFEQPIRCGREGLTWPPAAADFDGDGRLDLAFSEPSRHQLSILLGKGNGEIAVPRARRRRRRRTPRHRGPRRWGDFGLVPEAGWELRGCAQRA
ncbi:MAG: FG-GAP repeat domain-containing protein [Planctomycetota bacterium]